MFAVLVAGCGGGGSAPPSGGQGYVGLFDQTATTPNTVRAHEYNPTARTIRTGTGTLDRSGDRLSILGLSGDVNAARTRADLDGGGFVTIVDGSTDFVALYEAQPFGRDPVFGVMGVPTRANDLPVLGTASYTGAGSASLQILDGLAVYDLIGDTNATVDFNTGFVDLTFLGLDGTRSTGIAAPTSVTDVAVIRIDNSNLVSGLFTGGDASLTSTELASVLSGTENTNVSGSLYGPTGDEIGGVLLIDDTSGLGTLLIHGGFLAD